MKKKIFQKSHIRNKIREKNTGEYFCKRNEQKKKRFLCKIDKYVDLMHTEQQRVGRTIRINRNKNTALMLLDFAERHLFYLYFLFRLVSFTI